MKIGAAVFIEDALHNANKMAEAGIPVLLVDTPWNQVSLEPGIYRVYSWSEIVAKLGY